MNLKEIVKNEYLISANEKITRIFKENGNIFFSTTKQENIFLVGSDDIDDERIVASGHQIRQMEISDVSSDKEWVQINVYYSNKKISFLYNVKLRKEVDKALWNNYYELYGFVEQNEKAYLKTKDGLIKLEDIWELIRK